MPYSLSTWNSISNPQILIRTTTGTPNETTSDHYRSSSLQKKNEKETLSFSLFKINQSRWREREREFDSLLSFGNSESVLPQISE